MANLLLTGDAARADDAQKPKTGKRISVSDREGKRNRRRLAVRFCCKEKNTAATVFRERKIPGLAECLSLVVMMLSMSKYLTMTEIFTLNSVD